MDLIKLKLKTKYVQVIDIFKKRAETSIVDAKEYEILLNEIVKKIEQIDQS